MRRYVWVGLGVLGVVGIAWAATGSITHTSQQDFNDATETGVTDPVNFTDEDIILSLIHI